jgi:hypothetical protein
MLRAHGMYADTILTAGTMRTYPIDRTSSWIPPTVSRVIPVGRCFPSTDLSLSHSVRRVGDVP